MSSTQVFQQKRVTEAGDLQATAEGLDSDIHQEIEVSHTTDGALSATATIWNISRASWRSINVGDPFRVGLGYYPDPFTTVFFGAVKTKHPPERDSGGIRYQISGLDQSMARVQGIYWSNTWIDPTIQSIVSDIAGRAGLGLGEVTVPGGTLGERWPICKENSLAYWLDQLVREAESQGQKKYEWHASGGQLHFHPRDRDGGQAVELTGGEDGNIIRLDESTGETGTEKTSGGSALEFEAYLDPRLYRDGLVAVNSADYNGVYRVEDYSFTTSTDTGDHFMRGTLEPTSALYEVDPTTSPAQETSTYTEQNVSSQVGGGGFQQI